MVLNPAEEELVILGFSALFLLVIVIPNIRVYVRFHPVSNENAVKILRYINPLPMPKPITIIMIPMIS